jgi:hypothetical protein
VITRRAIDIAPPDTSSALSLTMIKRTLFGISAGRGPAWVVQSVTALPAPVCDQLTEELRAVELLMQLLAAVAFTVGARTGDRSRSYGGSLAIRG